MSRTAAVKLLVTALSVLSLGLTVSSAALAQEEGFAPGEPTPGQPVPPQTPDPGTQQPDGGTPAPGTEEGGTPTEPDQETQERARYERFCNLRDAEPSHSDKKFCEEYRRKHPEVVTSAAAERVCRQATDREQCLQDYLRYQRYCNLKDAEPSHSDKKFCEEYRKKYPEVATAGATGKPPTTPTTQPAAKTEDDDDGPLAFTGLEIWQLALIGLALIAGGFGVRRLLTN